MDNVMNLPKAPQKPEQKPADPTSRDIVREIEHKYPINARLTLGQKYADKMTSLIGSWRFITLVVLYIIAWIFLNVYFIFINWDPYPFIVLNLTLSCLAALQAPVILMSQNREAEKDRIRQARDYMIDRATERKITVIEQEIHEIKSLLKQITANTKRK